MTKFAKERFYGSETVSYATEVGGAFVARFKYVKSGKGSFITFLIKNFTVEEYFDRLNAGEAPLTILRSKGYLQPHVKKMLKCGYPITMAGFDKMIKDQIAARP